MQAAPIDPWGAMCAVLAGEPAPTLPDLEGRRFRQRLLGDDDPRQRRLTDATVWRALAREVCPLA
ncbi:MAG: hypothetical protein KGI90_07055 [Burkholderiales bacterium]|nr:hypothetical protein [Burkholderiales bacterium]